MVPFRLTMFLNPTSDDLFWTSFLNSNQKFGTGFAKIIGGCNPERYGCVAVFTFKCCCSGSTPPINKFSTFHSMQCWERNGCIWSFFLILGENGIVSDPCNIFTTSLLRCEGSEGGGWWLIRSWLRWQCWWIWAIASAGRGWKWKWGEWEKELIHFVVRSVCNGSDQFAATHTNGNRS